MTADDDYQASTAIDAVPVKLTDIDLELIRGSEEFTPVFGEWVSLLFTGVAAEKAPQVLLPADLKRRQANLVVTQPSGTPAGGFVLIGSLTKVANGQGGRVYVNGPRWQIRSHAEMWIAGDGATALTVTMLIERDQGE